MTEDASAGRVYADVLADTSGFRKDAERKLKTALKDLKAKARVQVDYSVAQARTALNTTMREVARDAKLRAVRAQVEFAPTQVRSALNAAMREAARDEKLRAIRAQVQFDPVQVSRALHAALRDAGRNALPVRVPVEADTWEARREIDRLGRSNPVVKVDTETETVTIEDEIEGARQRQSSKPINIQVRADHTALTRFGAALTKMTMMPVIADGAFQLAGGLIAIASSAGQAVGVLAAVPNAAGVAVQGLASLLIGFSGIGDAVKAMGKAQQAAGTQATKSAASQAAAAEQVRSAQERLARAQEAAAEQTRAAQERLARAQEQAAERVAEARQRLSRVVESAAERGAEAERRLSQVQADGAARVEDAERRVTAAHLAREQALKGLAAATEAAIERQEDLALTLSGAALDEESAELALERARIRLEQITGAGSTASELDKREADLAYRQAIQRLNEVRERNGDLAKEKAEADRKGIAGSDEVVAAQQRIIEATEAEMETQRNLAKVRADVAADIADAQRDLAKIQRDNARDVKDAQADLVKAQRDGARDVRDAQRDLVKAQRDGARDIADAQRDLARAMKPATTAATGQAAAITALNTAMDKLSPAGRRFARFVKGTLEPRWRALRNAVQEALLPHIQKAVTYGMPLLDTLQKGLVDSADRVGRFGVKLGRLFGSKTFNRDVSKIMASNNRALSDFGDAGIALIKILTRVAKVAGPILLEPFAKWTEQLAESAEKSDKLSESRIAKFLKEAATDAKKLGKIFGNVVKGIANIVGASRPAGDSILDDLVAASERFVELTGDPANQERMTDFFNRMVPVLEKVGKFLERVSALLLRIQELGGGRALEGFLSTMEVIVGLLERLFNIPGVGGVVATLLTLAGVGLALGLVATAIGGIVKNLGRLARFTGLSKLLGGITRSFRDMGDEAEKEVPKDKKKSDALKDVGDKAKTTKTRSDDLGKGFDDLGGKAKNSARKSRGLAGALKKIGDRAKESGGLLGGLFGGGKDGKGGKGGKLGTVGKVGGVGVGAASLAALLFGDDIAAMLGDGVGGGTAQGAITGGTLGSTLGPIGTLIGSLFGAGFGAVKGGGGNVGHAAIGSLLGLPGLIVGGFGEQILTKTKDLAAQVRPQIDKLLNQFRTVRDTAPTLLRTAWERATQTVPQRLSQLPTQVSGLLGQVGARFGQLRTNVPTVLRAAWRHAVDTIPGLRPIATGVTTLAGGVRERFDKVRREAPELLRNAWRTAVNTVPGLKPIVNNVSTITNNAREKFNELRERAPQLLSTAWRGALGTIPGLRPLATRIGEVTETGRRRFDDLRAKAPQLLSTAWRNVLGTIPTLSTLPSRIKPITDGVERWFKSAVGGVKTNWDRLPSITGGPIKTVASRVFNSGLVTIWNAIANKIPGFAKLDPIKLNFATGGILPGYTPGRDVHTFVSPTGGLLGLSGGEGILRPELTRVLGRGFIDSGNAAARSGGTGGVQRWLRKMFGPGQGFASGGIFEGVGNFLKSAKNFFTGGLKKALSGAMNPILGSVTQALSGSPYGQMIAGAARHVASKVIAHVLGFESQLVGGDVKGVVAAAKKYLGQGDRGRDNDNVFNDKWGFGPGTPWCANFVSTAVQDAKAGKYYAGYPTAAVYGYWSRMRKVGTTEARPGDLGVYGRPDINFGQNSHINIVEKGWEGGSFTTIGGNENSVVRRARRNSAFAILRPGYARGGVIDARVFREKNEGYSHDRKDPLYRLMASLNPSVAMRVSQALAQTKLLNRDSGGPLYPGRNVVDNRTGALEWVLTPDAVRLLGGPGAVQALNDQATRLHHAGRAARAVAARATHHTSTASPTVNVFPQPRQSEHEIAMGVSRKLGQMLRRG